MACLEALLALILFFSAKGGGGAGIGDRSGVIQGQQYNTATSRPISRGIGGFVLTACEFLVDKMAHTADF